MTFLATGCRLHRIIRFAPRQNFGRDRQADLLGGFQVDHKLELHGLLHRQIGWLRAFQNLIDEDSGAEEAVGVALAE